MGKQNVKARYARKLVTLGVKVRKCRVKNGFSQEKLADTAGISINSVNTIESGKLNPSAATLYAIADALGVEARDFL